MGKKITDKEAVWAAKVVHEHGGIKAASREEGFPYTSLKRRYDRAIELNIAQPLRCGSKSIYTDDLLYPEIKGQVEGSHANRETYPLPPSGQTYRYILTSAQNNTFLYEEAWNALCALADHYDARLMVGTFSYQKARYGSKAVKRGTKKSSDSDPLWYDPRLESYFVDHDVELAPGLIWVGRFNRLPTAVNPLSGFESHTGRKSGIFPHVKVAMQSVASMKYEPTKFNYTTGTVTQRNYLQKAAGIKAEFHHSYGGLLVEVGSDGTWFVRQLHVDTDGCLYDLTKKVHRGLVRQGVHRLEGITWGDIHIPNVDPVVRALAWDSGGILDTLRPRRQYMHDLLDFRSQNHHERNDPWNQYEKYVRRENMVDDELHHVVAFLERAKRRFCETIVVDSNHDNALTRWLKETNPHRDPANAEIHYELSGRAYKAIKAGDRDFHVLEYALQARGCPEGIEFLREDASSVICHDANGGIECAIHGHNGLNGRPGSPGAFRRMGRKANTAHTHQASIIDGVYTAGTSSLLDLQWNRGQSAWSHSYIGTYQNGKRFIGTIFDEKWCAL